MLCFRRTDGDAWSLLACRFSDGERQFRLDEGVLTCLDYGADGGTDEILGRNGGYVYIAWTDAPAVADAADQPLVDQARARALEILGGMTFRDIEFADDDLLVLANKFPAFTTTDLNGNAVTEEIFLGKALTVVNIWGTFCDPCVNEMPLLAA